MNMHKDGDSVVTVYITNYNYANYVEQAIESVLKQTYQFFELIIIDDGSTDDSRKIISRYAGQDRVRIIFQENKGLNVSNNIAVHASNSDYIVRLDADDYFDENALLVMVNAISQSNDLALVFSDYYYVDKSGEVIGQERRHDFQKDVSLLDQPAHGACTIIRRDCLLEVDAYNEEFSCQDGWDLWLKLTETYKVANVRLPLFYYRQHGENLTTDTDRLLETRAAIYENHVARMSYPQLKIVAVIPVRGRAIDSSCQMLEQLGGKPLINWTVDAALDSHMIEELIVTTPDPELLDHLNATYGHNITIIKRTLEESLENSYAATIQAALQHRQASSSIDGVIELTAESPFRSSFYINKSINIMRTHDVNVVIGVIPEDDSFYKHTGAGLEVIGNNHSSKLRLERNYIYRQCGGINLRKYEHYIKDQDRITKKIGHIVLSKRAGIRVRNEKEMKVARSFFK